MSYPMSSKQALNVPLTWYGITARVSETLKSCNNTLLVPSPTTESHIPLSESLQKNDIGLSSTQLVISYIWAEKPQRRK